MKSQNFGKSFLLMLLHALALAQPDPDTDAGPDPGPVNDTDHVAGPVNDTEPVADHVAGPVNVTEPVADHVAGPVNVIEPVADHVAGPVNVTEPVAGPVKVIVVSNPISYDNYIRLMESTTPKPIPNISFPIHNELFTRHHQITAPSGRDENWHYPLDRANSKFLQFYEAMKLVEICNQTYIDGRVICRLCDTPSSCLINLSGFTHYGLPSCERDKPFITKWIDDFEKEYCIVDLSNIFTADVYDYRIMNQITVDSNTYNDESIQFKLFANLKRPSNMNCYEASRIGKTFLNKDGQIFICLYTFFELQEFKLTSNISIKFKPTIGVCSLKFFLNRNNIDLSTYQDVPEWFLNKMGINKLKLVFVD
jgi:hypothetical protein